MTTFPEEYIEFLAHFHGSRDYFECHEIMEEFWLDHARDKKWLTLIQIAVAAYHERQKNIAGSLRLYRKVLSRMHDNPGMLNSIYINETELEEMIKQRINTILKDGDYKPFNLPLTDENLINKCRKTAADNGWKWLSDDTNSKKDLILRHKLRDRSDVIKAREDALLMKNQKREQP